MSKKYMIIIIAACIVSLGIGVFIGGGLEQNDLSATGALQIKPVQDITLEPDPEAIADEIKSAEKTISALEDELAPKINTAQEKSARAQAVGVILADVRNRTSAGKPKEMTQAIYDLCSELDIGISEKPGDILDRREWKGLELVIGYELDLLYEAADIAESDLQSVRAELARALNLLEDLKKLYDLMVKESQLTNGN